MYRSGNSLICFLAAVSVFAISCDFNAAQGQEKKSKRSGFDVEKFLKRLDTNGNGKVEPSEIKDERTKGFLKKAGVDPSKPVSIKGFSKRVAKERKQRANPAAAQQTSGFAVADDERDIDTGDSPGFAVSDEEREPVVKARARQFSDGAKKMLDWVLKNYDKNKDGKIDKNEIKSGRWSDPPAKESDTNKDGSLSRMELLVRYQKREDAKAKRDKAREKSKSSRSRERSKESSRSRRDRRSSNSRSNSSAVSKATSAKAGSRDVRKGYESYVDGLFKTYDKNSDGFLDKKEIEGMRRKPDGKADANGDKKISKSELIDSYLEKAGQSTGRKGRSADSKRTSESKNRGGVSTAADDKQRPQLTAKDKNKNGQIEMAEYAETWTVETVAEFYKVDKNKDGVITQAELNSK